MASLRCLLALRRLVLHLDRLHLGSQLVRLGVRRRLLHTAGDRRRDTAGTASDWDAVHSFQVRQRRAAGPRSHPSPCGPKPPRSRKPTPHPLSGRPFPLHPIPGHPHPTRPPSGRTPPLTPPPRGSGPPAAPHPPPNAPPLAAAAPLASFWSPRPRPRRPPGTAPRARARRSGCRRAASAARRR